MSAGKAGLERRGRGDVEEKKGRTMTCACTGSESGV